MSEQNIHDGNYSRFKNQQNTYCAWYACFVLAFCVLVYVLIVCADIIVQQNSMGNTEISTTAGPPEISDICPGIDYVINQTSTKSAILQVNGSDCQNNLPEFPSHQGVVYGMCDYAATFCKMHVVAPWGMYVRAHVHRLEYWCDSTQWRMNIRRAAFFGFTAGDVKCNSHSLEEMFFDFPMNDSMHVMSYNNPALKIHITTRKDYDMVQYSLEDHGYLSLPYQNYYSKDEIHLSEELKAPNGSVIILSIQQSFMILACPHFRPVEVIYRKPNTTRQTVAHVCAERSTPANVFQASYVKLNMHYSSTVHSFLNIYFSTLFQNDQPHLLPNGLFNCSVEHYVNFQHHLHCNVKAECEDGRDETEHCVFSSPGCQGLVASRNKCFKLVIFDGVLDYTILHYECQRIGGRLASIKTRKEHKDSLHIFKHYHKFEVGLGYMAVDTTIQTRKEHEGLFPIIGSYNDFEVALSFMAFKTILPFLHRRFCKWSDNTLIYNTNQLRALYPHFANTMLYSSGLIGYIKGAYAALCEIKLETLSVIPLQTTLLHLQAPWSIFINTRQVFFVCTDEHVTHTFLLCNPSSHRKNVAHSQRCPFLNVSDNERTEIEFSERKVSHTHPMFICDDELTTVDHTLVCDFRQDCPDNSDESFCKHPTCNGFLCSNTQCVLYSQRCNEYSDCLDDSDELNCPDDKSFKVPTKEEDKKQRFIISLDGTGYFTKQEMKADESCPHSHYRCTAEWLYCLPVYTRCNGFSDCIYGEDEQDCERMTCPGFFQCRASRMCVHGDHLCDGWGQCPHRDDELLCDRKCPEGCLCQGHSFMCPMLFSVDLFPELHHVEASGSGMSLTDFHKNIYLLRLNLSHCSLINISSMELTNLQSIDLANNYLETLDVDVILKLPSLRNLHLANNPLRQMTSNCFYHIHYELRRVDISQTRLNILNSGFSVHLPRLKYLNISFSAIETVGCVGFKTMPQLTELDVRENEMNTFPFDLFLGSMYLKKILTSNYRLCCNSLLPVRSGGVKCLAPHTILPSCKNLIPTELYKVFFWLVSVSAISGNVACFVASSAVKKMCGSNFVKVIAHLQFANICMGIHVIIAVIADKLFRGKYMQLEKIWVNSVTCKVNGFIFLLSSEVSVFLVCFITLDHTTILCFPKDLLTFKKKLITEACVVIWFIGIIFSLIPFLPRLSQKGMQGQFGLCRAEILDKYNHDKQSRWFFVLMAVNFILSLMVVVGQVVIYGRTPKCRLSLNPMKRSVFSAIHLIRKVSVTNAICWFSFGLVMIMASRFDATYFDKMYGAMVVFMLPLSSALNPLLYVWATVAERRGRTQEEKLIGLLKSRLALSGRNP